MTERTVIGLVLNLLVVVVLVAATIVRVLLAAGEANQTCLPGDDNAQVEDQPANVPIWSEPNRL